MDLVQQGFKKKVAFCLKGTVSKKGSKHQRFYEKNDLYRNGEYIDYNMVRDSIFKHIVTSNPDFDFDFFLHGWNLDLENHLRDIYNPKKFLFENNSNYNEVISSVINNGSDFGGVSGGLSLKKSIELKEIYEIESNVVYDYVIIYRYDILLWKDIILHNYYLNNYIYVNGWDGSCNADFHFIMSNSNSHKFKYLFDSVKLYDNTHKFHHWIKNYTQNIIKCNIIEDSIIAGIDQEHMRVIGNDINLLNMIENKK
jgi:hypothetical protein